MNALILTVHIIVCVSLITLVLLQSGKEGMGVIFGGSSGTVFGSSGAGGLLSKLTAGAATIFIITSLAFTYMSAQERQAPRESVVLEQPAQQQAPSAAPGTEKSAGQEGSKAVNSSSAD